MINISQMKFCFIINISPWAALSAPSRKNRKESTFSEWERPMESPEKEKKILKGAIKEGSHKVGTVKCPVKITIIYLELVKGKKKRQDNEIKTNFQMLTKFISGRCDYWWFFFTILCIFIHFCNNNRFCNNKNMSLQKSKKGKLTK